MSSKNNAADSSNSSTLEDSFDKLKNSAKDLYDQITEALSPVIDPIVSASSQVKDALPKLPSPAELPNDDPPANAAVNGAVALCDKGSAMAFLTSSHTEAVTVNVQGEKKSILPLYADDVKPVENIGYFGRCAGFKQDGKPCKFVIKLAPSWNPVLKQTNAAGTAQISAISKLKCPAGNGEISITDDGQDSIIDVDWPLITVDKMQFTMPEDKNEKPKEELANLIWNINDKVKNANLSDEVKKKLMWDQEKVNYLVERCAHWYNLHGVYLDPRYLLAVAYWEGTGSFNSNNHKLARDGGAGIQAVYKIDIESAGGFQIMGKLLAYTKYGAEFKKLIDRTEFPGIGDIFEYINYYTPRVLLSSAVISVPEGATSAAIDKLVVDELKECDTETQKLLGGEIAKMGQGIYAGAISTSWKTRLTFDRLVFHRPADEKQGIYTAEPPSTKYTRYILSTTPKVKFDPGTEIKWTYVIFANVRENFNDNTDNYTTWAPAGIVESGDNAPEIPQSEVNAPDFKYSSLADRAPNGTVPNGSQNFVPFIPGTYGSGHYETDKDSKIKKEKGQNVTGSNMDVEGSFANRGDCFFRADDYYNFSNKR